MIFERGKSLGSLGVFRFSAFLFLALSIPIHHVTLLLSERERERDRENLREEDTNKSTLICVTF